MPWFRRDQIGHFIRRDQPAHRHCTHACCRGYREHPDNWPVIPENKRLRAASDEQLAKHFRKVTDNPDPQARRAELQIINELERRDRAELRQRERAELKARRKESIAANRAATRAEREAETERIRIEAESVTRGYLVNAKGRARGIDNEEILTGRMAVFQRYASDEARDYFASNPRPTAAYFRGANTRMVERYR